MPFRKPRRGHRSSPPQERRRAHRPAHLRAQLLARGVAVLALGAALVAPLAAQTAPSVTSAAGTITPADVQHRIGIIADDSMLGRDTPSRGLDETAAWVAGEFRRFGLAPGGDRGTFFQRYSITRRRFEPARSALTFRAGGHEARLAFTADARLVQGDARAEPLTGGVLLVGGRLTADAVARASVRGRIVLVVPNAASAAAATPAGAEDAIRALYLAGPRAIVLLSVLDPTAFAVRLPSQASERTTVDLGLPRPVVVEAREDAAAPALSAVGVHPAALRAATTAVVRDLPALTARLDLAETILSSRMAPNTIGVLEGTDPVLKHQYVLFSAHMDHIGITPGQPDSINNGADDDASGTVGVVELAEAMSRRGARPRRSTVFLTVSGEEKGLWGSRYFSEHPTVPLDSVVADLNMDMIGRNWADTIVAIGKEHSDLGATLERVNAAHPELRMHAIDDRWPAERFYFRSDHYNFARKGVPILFFFNGVHEDYHRVTDSVDKINAEKESRILKLVYYLGQEIGNGAERPKWREQSYKEIVEKAATGAE
ncbi:MAG TPA: M28 family peptidase [Gemmatimonadales bacterium]|nr:M28 family peptidase [Gemmatimonadales bacterium]